MDIQEWAEDLVTEVYENGKHLRINTTLVNVAFGFFTLPSFQLQT